MNNETALRSRIARLRNEVDSLDLRFLEILAKRIEVVQELSVYKSALGIPPRDAEREEQMAELHSLWAERLGLPEALVRDLFSVVLQSSREIQASLRRGPVEMTAQMNDGASAGKIRA